ncbi:MAG TPA: hypothetical protein VK821_18410 [Dehalococcoidia bacterium]|nr:hypothetical protein [Dehalococcoidia bacterium]
MQIKNSVRTLTLASMLTLSVLSPFAVHVHADTSGGSGGPSVPGDCTDNNQAYQNANANADGTHTQFPKGQNIPQGTSLQAVDPNGNVNDTAKYKCTNGKVGVATLVIQPGRFRPVGPVAGAATLP